MSNGAAAAPLSADAIARRLAPVVGDEAADAAVREVLRELGYADKAFARWEQSRILERLAQRAGLLGSAARRAQKSMGFGAQRETPRASMHRFSTPPPGPNMIDGTELIGMFARALGDEKARETVETECQRLSVSAKRLPITKALVLLDDLAAVPGIVGVTARFAKARLALRG